MMPSELPPSHDYQNPSPLEAGSQTTPVHSPSDFQSPILAQPIFEGRLHPLTLVFGLWKSSRAAIPIITLIIFGNRLMSAGILVMVFGGMVLSSLVRYFSFRYRIEGNELITQQGILHRKQRNIPLERVQEIRIEQGVFHRFFDVVDAKIETGGGGGAEASLSVLSRGEAERLRHAVFERVAAIKAERTGTLSTIGGESLRDRKIIRQLGLRDLILAGLTSNHLVSAMVLAGALWNFADDILPESIYQRGAEFIYAAAQHLFAQGAASTALIAVLGILAVFLIGLIFSILGTVTLFYGFTFSRRGEDLHRSYGLLTQRASSLPRRRIQVLKIEEKMMRRFFGLAALRADTSGSHREDEDDNKGRDVLIPILWRREVADLLPVIFPDIDTDQAAWRRVSKLAIRRGVIKGGIFCLVLATALIAYQGELIALWPLALLPLIYYLSVLNYRHLGYAVGEFYFRTRRGWLGRSTHIVPINKIQAVEIQQTPFDRRLGLATVHVDTAGQAYTGGGPHIANLPINEARTLAGLLAQKAAITRYRW